MDIREEFREEGRRLGWRKGRLAGMQAGMQAQNQKVAVNMLRNNLSISLISKVTGLPVQEIKKLKNR